MVDPRLVLGALILTASVGLGTGSSIAQQLAAQEQWLTSQRDNGVRGERVRDRRAA